MPLPSKWKPRTLAAQALGAEDPITKGVVPPLHAATTFVRDPDNLYRAGYIYARPDNATIRQTEAVIAALEGAQDAMLFGSGMAASTALVLAFRPPSHIVASKIMYWGFRNWLIEAAPRYGYQVDLVDTSDLGAVAGAVQRGRTKLVFIETPANPLWTVTDIAAVAEIARRAGAVLCVDSTVATPVFTQPLRFGADVVMHSATKYLNGHSDVVAGALAFGQCGALWEQVTDIRTQHGAILGPFEAWLLLRSLRTLDTRVRVQAQSAAWLASRLEGHGQITHVLYPGLADGPGHAIAARQMIGGFGAMLSVRVRGGEAAAIATAARIELWKRATSLGGVESLLEHRASIEGPDSPAPPDLLRLSVGLEDAEDLYADLDQALRAPEGLDREPGLV
jgi:cystathionine gamma-synthase